MPKISRLSLTETEMQHLTDAFWQVLAQLRTPKDIKTLLAGFLTHTEVKMFAKRLEAVKMLLNDASYSDIRNKLKLTDAPIARLNNLLNEHKAFQDMAKRLSR